MAANFTVLLRIVALTATLMAAGACTPPPAGDSVQTAEEPATSPEQADSGVAEGSRIQEESRIEEEAPREPLTAVDPVAEFEETIGSATMQEDGTIVMRLRTIAPGPAGEGAFTYSPAHPEYDAVLRHIGPIGIGETVPVKPWPDEQ